MASYRGVGVSAADPAAIKHNLMLDADAGTVHKVQVGRSADAALVINTGGVVRSSNNSEIGSNLSSVGHLTLNGGNMIVVLSLNIGLANSAGSTVTIRDGLLTVGIDTWVAKTSDASLTMTGGSVITKNLVLGQTNAVGTFSLHGGSLSVTNAGASIAFNSAGSKLDIQNDAELIWSGNRLVNINAFVTSGNLTFGNGSGASGAIGQMTWYNGNGDCLNGSYDGITDKTTVWVSTIQKPPMVGMIGLDAPITQLICYLGRR